MAADVSLAMVQQSLLERFAASATPFQQAFYEGARTPAIRTASSITFACRPEASADTDLLEGLQSANQQFQAQHVERLRKRYQGGMGGMGGGMGGMSAGSI